MRSPWSYLDSPTPIVLAHRGAHGAGIPENSVAAFTRAVDLGCRYVETDVHATADGVLVTFHDPTLDRVTDRTGRIADLTYREVSTARLADGTPIPLLEDLLGTWPSLRVNIDAKDDRAVGPLLDVLARTRAHPRVCVGAFSDRRIRDIRRALPPGTATALAPGEIAALRLHPPAVLRRRLVPDDVPCVQVPISYGRLRIVDRRFVQRAHAQGRVVHVWTIDDPVQMHEMLDLGVDGLVTDQTETALAVVAGRHREQVR